MFYFFFTILLSGPREKYNYSIIVVILEILNFPGFLFILSSQD